MKKALLSLFLIAWIGLSLFMWLRPSQDSSMEERRKLNQFPTLNANTVISGDFANKFETYAQDQFPQRFTMRQVKAWFRYYGLRIFENNDYFIDGGKIVKIEYPLKESEITKAGKIFRQIQESFADDANVYVSIIPDKAYYSSSNQALKLDYEHMEALLLKEMDRATNNRATYVDIKDSLTLDDFYNTDIHWKQENLRETAQLLLTAMNKDLPPYDVRDTEAVFIGGYRGLSALRTPVDTLRYVTNRAIENGRVRLPDDKNVPVYDERAFAARDQYDFYLHGPQAIVEIENDQAISDDELIVFRDSFGSSLAPYFIDGYKKITLVDLRYISKKVLAEYIEFSNQDVLFIFSGTVLNSSTMFK